MRLIPVTLAAAIVAAPAFAGDPAAGERMWRQCQACHMIVSPEGETIQRGQRTGPNLYGVVGRAAGAVEDFRYSPSMVAAGEAGLVWDEENFIAYTENPTGFLREFLGDNSARGSMAFQLRQGAADLYAYLDSVTQ
ncbi:c-type cytochrome [Rhodobaculum claviforme]|uniref:Cytochrome C n=1 Tax=Rhodobaculum claviforme TaxID=1549854 RepID=A0A934TMU4_9RHOB|nr:cytochrome C [Rhodobaculum claviforme]MBK5928690.1 cytochrome C [Rhodobaculum claviforme]